jgi:hypothetical protein
MNFLNAAFDGKRGVANDTGYREYIPSADKTAAVKLAKQMRSAIQAVRGRNYTVMQSMSLYPTAGTSDDYAYSRHLANPTKPKIFSYTVRVGERGQRDAVPSAVSGDETDHPGDHRGVVGVLRAGVGRPPPAKRSGETPALRSKRPSA